MAIASSGTISIGTSAGTDRSITGEFGGTAPHALSEYLRGGSLVPDVSQNSNIPTTTSNIAMSDYYGSVAAIPIPIIHDMRNNSTQLTAYVNNSETAGIIFANQVSLDIKMTRTLYYVEIAIRRGGTYDNRQFWSTSGVQSSMGTGYHRCGRFNLYAGSGAMEIKMDWTLSTISNGGFGAITGNTSQTGATYSASDNTYQTVNVGQSIGARLYVTTGAECFDSNVHTSEVVLNGYARTPSGSTGSYDGRQETPLGYYRFQARSSSTSNGCF